VRNPTFLSSMSCEHPSRNRPEAMAWFLEVAKAYSRYHRLTGSSPLADLIRMFPHGGMRPRPSGEPAEMRAKRTCSGAGCIAGARAQDSSSAYHQPRS
jgi:hypothetical protein